MSDVVGRAKTFTNEYAGSGNLWRMHARDLIIELTQEVERLEAIVMDSDVVIVAGANTAALEPFGGKFFNAEL